MSELDWSSTRFREALLAMARKRVPAHEVEDIVQSALTEAIGSPHRPAEPEAARKWIWGIARNKVADYHRRARREQLSAFEAEEPAARTGLASSSGAGLTSASGGKGVMGASSTEGDGADGHAERDLLRWATRALPQGKDAQETLAWLLREGEGEKLEDIAESAQVPAPRVRKRVSRLRAHLREHWAKEVAAMAALGILLGFVAYLLRGKADKPEALIANEPVAPLQLAPRAPEERAIEQANDLRKGAAIQCGRANWEGCLAQLDAARDLDPRGDEGAAMQQLRSQALAALHPTEAAPKVPTMPMQSAPQKVAPSSKPATVPMYGGKGASKSVLPAPLRGTQVPPQAAPAKPNAPGPRKPESTGGDGLDRSKK
jgi:RNA polymerase sigma factor (sigma-70 family)